MRDEANARRFLYGELRSGSGIRAAFTLVELLTVIAIIGVLVALLMPAVMRSRTSAERIQCQSQLRQVGLALENYMNAHGSHGKYPNAAVSRPLNQRCRVC